MNYQFYIADVFSNSVFDGAQIAVIPNAEGISDKAMQLIAREFNLSETVFVTHDEKDSAKRRMRIFSPLEEKDFAGHPIIATAYVLGVCGDLDLSQEQTPITFVQNLGEYETLINSENGRPVFVQFTSRSSSRVDRFTPIDEEMASILSLKESELDHKKYSPRLVSCGFPYLVVPVWSYDSVRQAKFNFNAWSQSVAPQTAASEILLFSPKSPYQDADFNLRLLGPDIGVHEDPPVGTTLPAFAAYLCSFESTRKGTYAFAVDRGDATSRRSVLNVEMDNKGKEFLTIRIGGSAVMFAEGQFNL